MADDKRTGILFVGHGTRDELGQAEFRQTAQLLRERLPQTAVVDCFLELAEPDIEAGVEKLVRLGVREIIAAPLLLFAAGHAKRDIPEAIEKAVRPHAEVTWRMAAPLGEHPAVLELATQRFVEARGELDEEATLVIVSRGSSDAEAIESVHRFASRFRERLSGVIDYRVCFLAAAEPKLDETLAWAAAESPANVIVQPHLLFHGQLIQHVTGEVNALKSANCSAEKNWSVARHLGPSSQVVDALLARISELTT